MSEMTQDPEEIYPPKPGGMVDTARKRAQAERDQADAAPAPPAPRKTRHDVPVQDHAADNGRARTFSVATGGANPCVEVLGADENRRNAILLTTTEPVVVSFNEASANDPRNQAWAAGASANGFVLPVNVPLPVNHKGVIWVSATSATATSVSVMASSYAPAEA